MLICGECRCLGLLILCLFFFLSFLYFFFFFFASRRRHTSLTCDWSSDVCSSDLAPAPMPRSRKRECSPNSRTARGLACCSVCTPASLSAASAPALRG